MRRSLLVLALASTAVTPAYADDAEFAGQSCGLAAVRPTTAVNFWGRLSGGDFTAVDVQDDPSPGLPHAQPAAITVHCWMQQDSELGSISSHNTASPALPHCDFSAVGYLPYTTCSVSYAANTVSNYYVCTWVRLVHLGVQQDVFFDEDGFAGNGVQCALVIYTAEGNATVEHFQAPERMP